MRTDDAEWSERSKTDRCRSTCAAYAIGIGENGDREVNRLSGDVRDPATRRAAQTKNYKVRMGRVSGHGRKNELVQALVLATQTPEEGGNSNVLVVRLREIIRKTAS